MGKGSSWQGANYTCLDKSSTIRACGDDSTLLEAAGDAASAGASSASKQERLAGKGSRVVHFVTSGGVFYRIKIMEDAQNDRACVVSVEPGRSIEELSAMESSALYLTEREREILDLVTHGFTNAEIADELHISLATVKSHLQTMYGKCGVSNRTSLVNKFFDAVFC